jgi:hypothetical protein
LDGEPPIVACPRHTKEVDRAWYVAGNLGEEVGREVLPWPKCRLRHGEKEKGMVRGKCLVAKRRER